jgi:hypothetical protein
MHLTVKVSLALSTVATLIGLAGAPSARAQQKKPNILVVFGDDVGYWNISTYNHGMAGYKTATGGSNASSCSSRHKHSSGNGCNPLGNFHRGKNRPGSTLSR